MTLQAIPCSEPVFPCDGQHLTGKRVDIGFLDRCHICVSPLTYQGHHRRLHITLLYNYVVITQCSKWFPGLHEIIRLVTYCRVTLIGEKKVTGMLGEVGSEESRHRKRLIKVKDEVDSTTSSEWMIPVVASTDHLVQKCKKREWKNITNGSELRCIWKDCF